MNTTLSTALFLSSKGQAQSSVCEDKGLRGRKVYHVLVSRSGEGRAFEQDDTCTLQVYRISYPYRQEGEGWGEPVVAAQPHGVVQKQGLPALLDYLATVGMTEAASAIWEPVEDAESDESQVQRKEWPMFVYICLKCGSWQFSLGIEETFGTLKARPGETVRQCNECNQPMYRVASHDRLRVQGIVEGSIQSSNRECGQNVENNVGEEAR